MMSLSERIEDIDMAVGTKIEMATTEVMARGFDEGTGVGVEVQMVVNDIAPTGTEIE